MGEVKFDFQAARQQEQKLDEIAVKMEQTVHDPYSETMQELKAGWQSDGSIKFIEKSQVLEEKLLGSASLIRLTLDALHRAYMKAEYIEEKAKEIAENRTANK